MFSGNPNDLMRVIQDVDQARVRDHNMLAKEVHKVSVQQTKAQQREQIEALKEVVTHTYSSSTNYTNLIIVAGYVGFFTVWKSMKDDLGTIIVLGSCLSVFISVVLFIISAIHTMLASAMFHRKFFAEIKGELPPTFVDDYRNRAQKHQQHMFKAWLILFIPTLAFGLMGGGLLVYGFSESLILEVIKYFQSGV